MTVYLLNNHQFRTTTARGRWTKRTNEGVTVYVPENGRGNRKHLEFAVPICIDTTPVKEKFRTILGVGEPRWNSRIEMINISFRCRDAVVVTVTDNSMGSLDQKGSTVTVSHATVSVRVVGFALDNLLVLNKALKLKLEAVLEIPGVEGGTVTIVTGELSAKHRELRNTFKFEQTVAIENPGDFYKHQNKVWEGRVSVQLIPGEGGGGTLAGLAPAMNPVGRKFLEENLHSDFTIIAQNRTRIPTHKLVLAAHSPVFQRMLESDCQETMENIIELDNSKEGVMAFLKFLYYSDIEDPIGNERVALELLELGHKYEISSLENVMKALFLSVDCYSVDVAVTLFHRSGMVAGYEDLKAKAVRSIKLRKNDLKESTVFDELVRKDPEMTKELFELALSN
ncbi:unnamed protein product [Orchesella dallaii]|uniref:BTB domain-containing protein n=1 Tax=Orchesella dallaii TaxID=48710 RepID=A0ABP1QN86_9HEXA